MMNSCDCNDKPEYSTLELAGRIDKCVDIVSRQEDTIDAQEKTIDVEIEDAEQNILDAIDELSRKIDEIQPIPILAIEALFDSSYLVSRRPELDEQYGKCVWAYVYDSINMPVDADIDPTRVDLNCLFFSDSDEIENNDVILVYRVGQFVIEYTIQGYDGIYVHSDEYNALVFKGTLLRIVRKQ